MASQQLRKFSAGEVIFKEGEVGDCAYLIERGLVQIYLTKSGQELALKTLGIGEVFGEMSLIDESPRSASCRAESETTLIVVTKSQLLERVRAADPVVRLLMQALLDRLRSQNERMRGEPVKGVTPISHRMDTLSQHRNEALARIALENQIAQALDDDEFVPFYQPIYDLASGQLRGCEALLRWVTKERGIIQPAVFMDVMEESALILRAGKVVIEKAMADLPTLRGPFNSPDFFVSINVSGRQFTDIGFIEHLESTRSQYGLKAENVKLELTERIMTEGQQALATLQRCRDLGYRLAIDDFGTGFSSLQYLAQMPLTDLKIDRSFVLKMLDDQKSLSIIKSLIHMAKLLNLNLIAEGIEKPEHLAMLRVLDVGMGQGYMFAKPLPINEFLKLAGDFAKKVA